VPPLHLSAPLATSLKPEEAPAPFTLSHFGTEARWDGEQLHLSEPEFALSHDQAATIKLSRSRTEHWPTWRRILAAPPRFQDILHLEIATKTSRIALKSLAAAETVEGLPLHDGGGQTWPLSSTLRVLAVCAALGADVAPWDDGSVLRPNTKKQLSLRQINIDPANPNVVRGSWRGLLSVILFPVLGLFCLMAVTLMLLPGVSLFWRVGLALGSWLALSMIGGNLIRFLSKRRVWIDAHGLVTLDALPRRLPWSWCQKCSFDSAHKILEFRSTHAPPVYLLSPTAAKDSPAQRLERTSPTPDEEPMVELAKAHEQPHGLRANAINDVLERFGHPPSSSLWFRLAIVSWGIFPLIFATSGEFERRAAQHRQQAIDQALLEGDIGDARAMLDAQPDLGWLDDALSCRHLWQEIQILANEREFERARNLCERQLDKLGGTCRTHGSLDPAHPPDALCRMFSAIHTARLAPSERHLVDILERYHEPAWKPYLRALSQAQPSP
jgi:hypothetical protein